MKIASLCGTPTAEAGSDKVEVLEVVRMEPARLVVVKGTTIGISTEVLVPGTCAVNVLDALVGSDESTVVENILFVIPEPVEARFSAVEAPVLARPATGVDPPAVAPSVCAVGALELTTTEPNEAEGVGTNNEADKPAVEPSPCVFEVLVIASSGPVEEGKLITAGPDVKIPGVVATEPAETVGVRVSIVRDPVGKGTLVVTLGKVLSMRVDPLVEDNSALGRTEDCMVESADERTLLPEGTEPIWEDTATFEKTGV